jgi:uncharacterized damage-inducible protein DinB
MAPFIETWDINQRMNELLLGDVQDAFLKDVSIAKGRSVGEQFAHIHNVRLMWLKAAAPDLGEQQVKIEKDPPITKGVVMDSLQKSAAAVATLLKFGLELGRIKGFKPHPEAFLGYMIAHEAHHRGQIILILKENGHLPGKKTLFGLWEWGTKS